MYMQNDKSKATRPTCIFVTIFRGVLASFSKCMLRPNACCKSTAWIDRQRFRHHGQSNCCSSIRPRVQLVAHVFAFVAPFVTASITIAQNSATVGQWSPVMTWPWMAVHAQVLPTGKVMYWPQFGYGDNPTLWDPSTNSNTAATHAGANIFCSGHAFLANVQFLVAGGHQTNWVGLPNAYTYNPLNDIWTPLPDMNTGRWYPTT